MRTNSSYLGSIFIPFLVGSYCKIDEKSSAPGRNVTLTSYCSLATTGGKKKNHDLSSGEQVKTEGLTDFSNEGPFEKYLTSRSRFMDTPPGKLRLRVAVTDWPTKPS